MKNNELLLLSKNDIPFVEAQVNIHQPTISEISLISEEEFFSGCQFLNFSKERLSIEDRKGLENKSDFEIFMSIMCNKERMGIKNSVMLVLALLFPEYQIRFTSNEIILISSENSARINKSNYDAFRRILIDMFGLNESNSASGDYNPADKRASRIAEKFKKAQRYKDSLKGEENSNNKVAVFSRYVSVLAVGEHKDINELLNYTVFQLKDEFKRFQKKQDFDIYLQAKMAGAQDLDEIDNWMDDIHF